MHSRPVFTSTPHEWLKPKMTEGIVLKVSLMIQIFRYARNMQYKQFDMQNMYWDTRRNLLYEDRLLYSCAPCIQFPSLSFSPFFDN